MTGRLLAVSLVAATLATVGVDPASAAGRVLIGGGFADQPVQPARFGPNKAGELAGSTRFFLGVKWDSWGGPTATATAQVRLLTDRHSTTPGTITLSGRKRCGVLMTYSHYAVELDPGATKPELWSKWREADFPCIVNAAGYVPSKARRYERHGGCNFPGLDVNNRDTFLPWVDTGDGHLPRPKWHPALDYPLFCVPSWKHWGKATAIGRAVHRNGYHEWGAKIRLTGMTWCPDFTITYTKLVITLYGAGEPIRGGGYLKPAEIKRLKADIGKRGLARKVYRQSMPASAGCNTLNEGGRRRS